MEISKRNRGKGIPAGIFVVILLLAVFIASAGTFFWQAASTQKQINENRKLTDELDKLKAENDKLLVRNSSLEKDVEVLKQQIPPEIAMSKRESLLAISDKVLHMIKAKDMASLMKMVHPDKGLRFTPYAYVNVSKDVVVPQDDVATLASETVTRLWGAFDGSGDPIYLTFNDYYKKFIYDADFLEAPQIVYNQAIQRGNSLLNIKEAYPGAEFIEYHFPGFDKQYNGMDWKSLRLVFEQMDGKWYLTGIAHDQWTI